MASDETIGALTPGSQRLLDLIRGRSGVNLSECSQCRKCSAGCTMASKVDTLPQAIIRLVQLGQEDEVFSSNLLWLCVSCQTCSTRCPNKVDFASVVDVLRHLSVEAGVQPTEPEIATFHEVTLETIRRHGRMYELSMIARLKMKTGEYTKDAGIGVSLFRHGKLRLLASNVRDRKQIAALFERGRSKG